MPTFPAKTNYAAGDVLTAAQMVDVGNGLNDLLPDAKGSLTTVSAANTPAQLTVGANGETLVADSSQTAGLRYNPPVGSLANPIINGGFDIWQRGTTFSNPASPFYTADRWQAARQGAASGITISRQATGDTTNLPNIQYCVRVQRDSGNTNTSDLIIGQSLETTNSIPFAGKTVTFSFYARKGALFSATNNILTAVLVSGTGTDQNNAFTGTFTNATNVIAQNATLTNDWQRFAFTGTIGATATQLAPRFVSTTSGTAGATDYFEITGVQIDVGTWTASTAPTFRRSGNTLAGELAACQRYYYLHASGDQISIGLGTYTLSNELHTHVQFPVAMRVAPTIDQATGTNFYRCYRNGASDDFDSFIVSRANTVNTLLYQTGATISGTAGDAGIIHTQNASARLAFTSEL